MVDTTRYKEWFEMAHKDLNSAKILYEHDADYGIVCFHCQQSIEKYLKGYLILKTGMLQEGHSLIRLCKKSAQFDSSFKNYLKDCTFVNSYYIETRYPSEDPLIVSEEEVEECLRINEQIVKHIDTLV